MTRPGGGNSCTSHAFPYVGITRIRYEGCNLSLSFPGGTPKQSGSDEREHSRGQIQSDMALLSIRILAPTYSPTTKGSTIGAAGLNDSVRNGRGVSPAL